MDDAFKYGMHSVNLIKREKYIIGLCSVVLIHLWDRLLCQNDGLFNRQWKKTQKSLTQHTITTKLFSQTAVQTDSLLNRQQKKPKITYATHNYNQVDLLDCSIDYCIRLMSYSTDSGKKTTKTKITSLTDNQLQSFSTERYRQESVYLSVTNGLSNTRQPTKKTPQKTTKL